MEKEPPQHHHHHHDHDYDHQHSPLKSPSSPTSTTTTTTTTAATCCNCGAPTSYAPPPTWSDTSPPPNYRPIRAPAINLPPSSHTQQAIILAPVPHSQKVPLVSPPYHFQTPAKKIQSPEDLNHFQNSDSGKNFLGFVVALSESIRSHKLSDPCHQSETINSIVSILETLIQWVDEIPPAQQTARYGNLSYRTWHSRLTETSDSLMLQFLPADLQSATIEIVPYFTDSFGNSSRIDYGTGHETNFAAWLYCLARLGVIKEEDYQAVVARVFVKYLELMRKLQLVYCLEPAGSHGVWGLDDYHFLPFIFGSSQLIDHRYMKPKSIHNDDILENFNKEYLYISCIAFVKKVKKGLFAEHSPLLDDISGVPTWNKVNSGLLKMYKVEVLEKVPIMQHFLFGWLIKWE
ncbi:serine/threonine-protein phosphatase 2A activator [Quercus lobata]|uniref:serine/threonine-protein phosphatase 2A activator n=1 Tax=Quercus lobata TaxID=97700 RepID=UPI00124424E3|nr:serine/threonine-protein phosphatase 2A activator [Quercus lobata]